MLAKHLGPGLLALAGCATSTGILPAGPDTYTVTEHVAPVRGGSSEAERVALTRRTSFVFSKAACSSL